MGEVLVRGDAPIRERPKRPKVWAETLGVIDERM
jgi:hypothetical protein